MNNELMRDENFIRCSTMIAELLMKYKFMETEEDQEGCMQEASSPLVACSVNRRMIAACPLAFGEVGVKERVKSVMNYKKPAFWVIILAVIACVIVAVCFLTNPKQDSYTLRIVVPAGSQEKFVYTDEEVSTIKNTIKIWSGDGLGDTEVLLSPVNKTTETGYTATYLTSGMPVEFDAEKDTWFKVGVNMQNSTNEDIIVYVKVENVAVRISDESTPDRMRFEAEILEIYDGNYLVKPVEGSWELNSADRIEVPIRNAYPSPEPEIGDVIEIEYSGEILETYPARITEVFSIRVVKEAETWALIPMVMVNGTLYLDTGYESDAIERTDHFDGEITSQVDGSERPSVDDQSNFGTGYGYQYGKTEGTIELFMNGKWWIFATEEARQAIQFPATEDEPSKFYLTIGSEGVKCIALSMPNASGGCENADGSLFKKGERIWLDNLDGYADLRGLTITALGENGEIIWTASVPDEEENKGFTHLVNDDWEITNIE